MANAIYYKRDRWPPTKPKHTPVIEARWKGPGGYWYKIRLPILARPVRFRTLYIEFCYCNDDVSALSRSPQSFKLEKTSKEATNKAAVGYYEILCPLDADVTIWVVDRNKRGTSPPSDVLKFHVPGTLAPKTPGPVTILKFEEIW